MIEGFETREVCKSFELKNVENLIEEVREEESEIKNEVSSKIEEKLMGELEKG